VGIAAVLVGFSGTRATPSPKSIETAPTKPALGAIWLPVSVGVIAGGLLGVVVFLTVRGRIRHARATRLYRSSSSPS
jgi:hypothetical protein